MSYKAFVFDLDGTLVDSRIDFNGMTSALKLEHNTPVLEAIEDWPHPEKQKAIETIHRFELEGAMNSTLIPGVEEFLIELKSKKIPVALFTRNSREIATITSLQHGLNFDLIITRDEAPPKPKPDGLKKIARYFGVPTTDMLFIGDYLYDLQAGLASQTPTALYLNSTPDFDTEGCAFTFSSYFYLKNRLWG
ncbi:MAG: HAD family hydrolase [Bdellovibrionales bacterium]